MASSKDGIDVVELRRSWMVKEKFGGKWKEWREREGRKNRFGRRSLVGLIMDRLCTRQRALVLHPDEAKLLSHWFLCVSRRGGTCNIQRPPVPSTEYLEPTCPGGHLAECPGRPTGLPAGPGGASVPGGPQLWASHCTVTRGLYGSSRSGWH